MCKKKNKERSNWILSHRSQAGSLDFKCYFGRANYPSEPKYRREDPDFSSFFVKYFPLALCRGATVTFNLRQFELIFLHLLVGNAITYM